jgi:uncharacterized protein YlxW (UPF0749 family)
MHQPRNQLTIAAVAFVLGLLVIVQLRTQASGAAFAGLSSQELTVLVANLNDRNDGLRGEIGTLERELATLTANSQRGEASIDELRADLRRVRLYAGIDAATGPGVVITVRGPVDGSGVEDLVNELRNAGAEAIAVESIRLVPGVVTMGAAGAVSVDGITLGDSFELSAIGAPDKLTGSLTRSGGIIAQLAATLPDVVVEVTPLDHVEVPATDRELVPGHGRPRLSAVPVRPVLTLLLGDVLRLRRSHPCGGDSWLVDRLGADIGLRCQTCSRHVLLERATLEQRFVAFVSRGDAELNAAIARAPEPSADQGR